MNLKINLKRLEDDRLQITVSDFGDERGSSESYTRTTSLNAGPVSERNAIGHAVAKLLPLPDKRPVEGYTLVGDVPEATVPPAAADPGAGSLLDPPAPYGGSASDKDAMYDLARWAIQREAELLIDYTKVSGDYGGDYIIQPFWIGETRDGYPATMTLRAKHDGINKSFKLSGINRMEVNA